MHTYLLTHQLTLGNRSLFQYRQPQPQASTSTSLLPRRSPRRRPSLAPRSRSQRSASHCKRQSRQTTLHRDSSSRSTLQLQKAIPTMAAAGAAYDPFAVYKQQQQEQAKDTQKQTEYRENLNSRLICRECREDPPNLTSVLLLPSHLLQCRMLMLNGTVRSSPAEM